MIMKKCCVCGLNEGGENRNFKLEVTDPSLDTEEVRAWLRKCEKLVAKEFKFFYWLGQWYCEVCLSLVRESL